jgi:hypothetical protein
MANGLINLQTDLTSLTYSTISPGSQEPYVIKQIGEQGISLPGGLGTEISRRIDDTTRIGKMLIDKPGIKFLLNQGLLQQVGLSDKIRKSREEGKTLAGALIKQVANTALTTAKIAAATLAQVPVNGTGTHFVYGFKTDTYLRNRSIPDDQLDLPSDQQQTTDGRVLRDPGSTATIDSNFYRDTFDRPVTQDLTGNANENYTLDDLIATSGSGAIFNNKYTPSEFSVDLESLDVNPAEIQRRTTDYLSTKDNFTDTVVSTDENGEQTSTTEEFGNINKEFRYGLSDQGKDVKPFGVRNRNQYWVSSSNGSELDNINYRDKIILNENGFEPSTPGGVVEDIIKFKFNILTPDKEEVVYFRAYLDSFNDNYTGQWNPVKYLGRAEDFQVYGGFQRKISLSFKIAAATRFEMRPLYRKMVLLASSTAPTYASSGQFMRGTIVKMTVGDYVYELPGVLNSLTYTWQQEYPWEIVTLVTKGDNTEDKYDNKMQQLPMVMDCQLEFTPIHTFTPETGLKRYFTHSERENSYLIKLGTPDVSDLKEEEFNTENQGGATQ